MTVIFLRTVLFYFGVTAVMRLMGKRQIGELCLPEFVAAVMLSEIATLAVTDRDIPFTHGAVPLITLSALEVITAYVCKKIPRLRKLVYGEPIVLAEDGKICEKALDKTRITADEVIAAVRNAGYAKAENAGCVILEQNGQISVIARERDSPLTFAGAGKIEPDGGAELNVMTEGEINGHFARTRGVDEKMIEAELKKRNLNAKDCVFVLVDRAGNIKTVLKEGKK